MTFTNMTYAEFDTTQQTLISDLLDNITACASWTKINSTAALVATTTATAIGAVTLTAGAGAWAAAGIGVGTVVRIGAKGAADCEYRTVTATASTTITIAALTYAHGIGTNVYDGHEVVKCTTTRGADMIVDLMDSHISVAGTGLGMAAYRAHTGGLTGGTGRLGKWLYWRSGTPVAANVIHCIVSASKEHLFISLEGPRYNETNPESATLGSSRNYFAICDLVPYFAGDTTPVATCIAKAITGLTASFPLDLYVNNTRDAAATTDWPTARLLTLDNPSNGGAFSVNFQRQAAGDGNWYLAPYVVVEDSNGERGRLAAFHFAGYINPDALDALVPSPPIGSKITYGGQLYKIVVGNKTGTNNSQYAGFGAVANPSNNANGIAIAIPCT
jgi:hypothetical protein